VQMAKGVSVEWRVVAAGLQTGALSDCTLVAYVNALQVVFECQVSDRPRPRVRQRTCLAVRFKESNIANHRSR
jgi:hypothetical protein